MADLQELISELELRVPGAQYYIGSNNSLQFSIDVFLNNGGHYYVHDIPAEIDQTLTLKQAQELAKYMGIEKYRSDDKTKLLQSIKVFIKQFPCC